MSDRQVTDLIREVRWNYRRLPDFKEKEKGSKKETERRKKGVNISNIANDVQSRMSTPYRDQHTHTGNAFPNLLNHPRTKKHSVRVANVKTAVELQLVVGQLDEDLLFNSGALERISKCFGFSHQSSLSWTDCHSSLQIP